ncbi:GIY-YIG nuclease family protein [Aciditerrimonas ferrireducens]|uniref:GIY-YIG nuclease family protein n=1 Tax=Aciditerrimonas ferrireducens TaxID=667306 RepID=A0ABV6C6V0_9ACTN
MALKEHNKKYEWSEEGTIPKKPGVYVWFSCNKSVKRVLYIGSTVDLRKRITQERNWIKDWQDSKESYFIVPVLYILAKFNAKVVWVPTKCSREAKELEYRLIEWHRALTGTSPYAYGWDTKTGSKIAYARSWAQGLHSRMKGASGDVV